MSKPVFILGLGAQKAGTSWLHHYLSACDRVEFGLTKEYHVWDVRQDPRHFDRFRVDEARLARHRRTARFPRLQLRYPMQTVDGFYAFYFQRLLRDTGKTMTGDITPSYAALDPATLHEIRRELDGAGFEIRVIFLMRDPVERLWSAVRHERRMLLNNTEKTLADLPSEADQVAQSLQSPETELRSRYDRTVRNIETVFDPAAVYFGFFETMFTEPALRDLAGFLDVPVLPDLLRTRVNATPAETLLPEALRRRIRDHYAPVYAFCHDRFPQTRDLWE